MKKIINFLTQRGWTNEQIDTFIANPHLINALESDLMIISKGLDSSGLSNADFSITLESTNKLISNIPESIELLLSKFPSIKLKKEGGNLWHFNLEDLLEDYKNYRIEPRDKLTVNFYHDVPKEGDSFCHNYSFKPRLKIFGLYKEHNILDALTIACNLINSGKIKIFKNVVIYLETRPCMHTRYLEISFVPKNEDFNEDRTLIEYWDTGNDEEHPRGCYIVS